MLREAVEFYVSSLKDEWSALKRERSGDLVGHVHVGDVVKGLRGVPLLLWEHSSLSQDGVVLRDGLTGLTDLDWQVEELLWLFLTGRDGSPEEIEALRREMLVASVEMERKCLLEARAAIDSLDIRNTPVISALCAALLAIHGPYSTVRNIRNSVDEPWQRTLEECLSIIVVLPHIAGYILEKKYRLHSLNALETVSRDHHSNNRDRADYSYSFAASVTQQIVCRSQGCLLEDCGDAQEFINLYLVLHSDHGGGNASAHTARLVGSTHADPFLTLSASLLALSGPLHGGANGDALQWLRGLQQYVEKQWDEHHADERESVRKYTQQWLQGGRKVPGFGHAVLRRVDPRVTALLQFAESHNDTFSPRGTAFLRMALPEVSSVLREGGKVRAPFPNVDAASGVLLDSILRRNHSGNNKGDEGEQMVVDAGLLLFAMGRSLGILTHLVLDRALGVPLERPNSLTMQQLRMRSKL